MRKDKHLEYVLKTEKQLDIFIKQGDTLSNLCIDRHLAPHKLIVIFQCASIKDMTIAILLNNRPK